MKPSRYNFFFQVDDQAILGYNSLTTALAELSAPEFAALQQFCTEPGNGYFEARGLGAFRDDLVKDGFLVPDDADEIAQIGATHAALKAQRERTIGLTLVPTLDCNFRCTYCFSYARSERMSAQVQAALLRFVAARLPGANGLSVTWYGGEPTLCLDVIETVTVQLRDMCERYGAKYLPAGMVTNGYLLTEKVAQRLKVAGITHAQITLDGDRDTHNRRRPLQGGVGTFDRILDNVAAARDSLEIQIRINVDRSNAGTAIAALDALIEHGLQGIPAYFGHVKPFSEQCGEELQKLQNAVKWIGQCEWFWCQVKGSFGPNPILPRLAESLKACGGEFYVKCPAFDELGRVCDFEPAIDAAKWKEQIQLDRIAKLETKVQELELKLKR